jgi:hypothetical protein
MPFDWPWSRQRTVICPDGTTQFVFKNIDSAFPFFFGDAKVSAQAAIEGMKEVSGKLDGSYETEIKHILVRIDEKNGSAQSHLRAAYVLYSAAPCKKLDYLEATISEIRQDERDLRTAELAIQQLSTLIGSGPLTSAMKNTINVRLGSIFDTLGRGRPDVETKRKMEEIENNSVAWQQ